ncbi:MAG TPA: alkaline phosphatase [Ohtaekwangia sp.]|uniref:alkaline phosphatase n=1 Tax=Ohtaekwangia sp. TaxID=2066019 RepID=UPI002F91C44E
MRKLFLLLFVLAASRAGFSQVYTSSSIHAHNDYVQPIPFFAAYYQQVGSIEADVFLLNNELYVAHTDKEIATDKTLDKLYLAPLAEKIKFHNGGVYAKGTPLNLLIDLKTEGIPTLQALVKKLKKYPALTNCSALTITISGSVPDPSRWAEFPNYIHFDGRPTVVYTPQQLARVSMISDDFSSYTTWNGKGIILAPDKKKIQDAIASVHARGKKIRFWATPDQVNAWRTLQKLQVDYIGTDNVTALATFIAKAPEASFQNDTFHDVRSTKPAHTTTNTKRVILLIGDGMGLAQMYAGYTANGAKLNLFNIPTIGFSLTYSADNYITDSAAGATAMASGTKTRNRAVGVDTTGRPLLTIPDLAFDKKIRSAVISAGDITDATPAAFYAHALDRASSEAIASDFIGAHVDILMGGGVTHFTTRKDGSSLAPLLQRNGYTVATNLQAMDTIRSSRYVVLDNAAAKSMKQGRGNFLTKALQKSLNTFTKDNSDFFIMAEGAQIDHGGHANNMEFVVREMLDFDEAIGAAMQYVDEHPETLLVITADHETGGLTLLDGDMKKGYIYGNFSTQDHTSVMVPVFAYGAGASEFSGVYQNTAIFEKIVRIMNIGK